jgi:type II restriction enzyme
VFVIRERELISKANVLEQWRSTLFLRGKGLDARGWLIEVMRCVDRIGQAAFTLDDVYAYEAHLSALYPSN